MLGKSWAVLDGHSSIRGQGFHFEAPVLSQSPYLVIEKGKKITTPIQTLHVVSFLLIGRSRE